MVPAQEPVRLTLHHLNRSAEVMGRAFYNDPLWRYLVPDDSRRANLLPSCFRLFVRYCIQYGEGYTTASGEGVACWLSPGNTTPTMGRMVRVAIYGAPLGFGWSAFRRYSSVADYTDAVHKHSAPGLHWYLWGLGVDPPYQGRGIGSKLMQPVLARADSDGLPCYLETMNERNLPLYQRHGFHIVSEGTVPDTKLYVWAMLREPGI